MKNTKEVVQHCFSMILVGHQAAQQLERAMAERDAEIAAMRAALIRHYDQEWDIGDGISDDEKVKFLIGQVFK